jgi:6-pyruvoyl tetrahydropterin synthase
VDIESFKRTLRGLCARLDSRTLIPGESQRLSWEREGEAVGVRCGERVYRFPAEDTLVLPLANTSIELLARMLWHDLAPGLAGSRVETLAVAVEETAGQQCWYEARVTP